MKRVASNKIKAGTANIKCAKDFADSLSESEVKVLELSEEETNRRNTNLKLKKIISDSKKIKDISKCHYFYVENSNIKQRQLSPQEHPSQPGSSKTVPKA